MASAWAQLSKEEQDAWKKSGMDKPTYNDKYGLRSGTTAPPAPTPAPTPEPTPAPTPAPTATAATPTASTSSAQTANRSEAAERAQNYTASASTQSNQTSSLPRISSLMEGYATDRKYTGPDGGTYTAKEADDAGWTAGYYDEGGGAYVPQQKTFDNPHSAEAIAYRQQYAKDTSKDGKYAEGMKYVSGNDPRRVYDSSANVGYNQDLTSGQELKQWHMSRAYKQKMEEDDIDWNASGGYHNYNFDMTKGYFVPNQSLRQQRASMYDNMFMRDADGVVNRHGDRDSYIHEYYDPLGGGFEYDNTYDM